MIDKCLNCDLAFSEKSFLRSENITTIFCTPCRMRVRYLNDSIDELSRYNEFNKLDYYVYYSENEQSFISDTVDSFIVLPFEQKSLDEILSSISFKEFEKIIINTTQEYLLFSND